MRDNLSEGIDLDDVFEIQVAHFGPAQYGIEDGERRCDGRPRVSRAAANLVPADIDWVGKT